MRKLFVVLAAGALLSAPTLFAQAEQTLDMYFIDVEGGQAALYVSPTGESLLFDVGGGSPASNARDVPRIMEVIREAGVIVLDHVIISHYHGDHVGGAVPLSEILPVRTWYDHGGWTSELRSNRRAAFETWRELRQSAHVIVPEPGEKIGITGLDVTVVSSAANLLQTAMAGAPGAGMANPMCSSNVPKKQDPTPENLYPIGAVIEYGSFRMLNLADLTWDQEAELVCPSNLLGTVDLYQTSRHGGDYSGNRTLVHSVQPRVAIMNNNNTKGGTPGTFEIVTSAPRLQDFWQLHYSDNVSEDVNSPEQFIANFTGPRAHDPAYYIKVSARTDGSFTVTNSRNGFSKDYPAASAGTQ